MRDICVRGALGCVLVALMAIHGANAQKVEHRSEFSSYPTRDLAEVRYQNGSDSLGLNEFYLELAPHAEVGGEISTTADIPFAWLDRDVFIQISGIESYKLLLNNQLVGTSGDGRTPTQFEITRYLHDGVNRITTVPHGEGGLLESALEIDAEPYIFIFSQPKLHIEDYRVTFTPDSVKNCGYICVEMTVRNSYNFAEPIRVGYDLSAPGGGVIFYNYDDFEVEGNGRLEVKFRDTIWRTEGNEWSEDSPLLYSGTMNIRHNRQMIEYIPFRVGLLEVGHLDRSIRVGGKVVDIKAVRYDLPTQQSKKAEKKIVAIKKRGYNTIVVAAPQPIWFYECCDRLGVYVIDQANINFTHQTSNRKIGGTYSNAPEWEEEFLSRVSAMYERTKNHTCVVGWSIGADVGNGYNIYRAYRMLKALDPKRAIIYNDSAGEWNSDINRIATDKDE